MKKTKPGRRVAEAQVSLAGWGPTIRYLLLQLSPHAQCAVVMSAFGGATAAALRGAGIPTLSGRELGTLALGAENGRQSREVFACWLRDGGGYVRTPRSNARRTEAYTRWKPLSTDGRFRGCWVRGV